MFINSSETVSYVGPHWITGNGVGFKPDILDMDVMDEVLMVQKVLCSSSSLTCIITYNSSIEHTLSNHMLLCHRFPVKMLLIWQGNWHSKRG